MTVQAHAQTLNLPESFHLRPTLHQDTWMAAFPGGHVSGILFELVQALPNPVGGGWTRTDTGMCVPLWTTIPIALISSLEIVRCGCLQGCTNRRCPCVKATFQCTAVCMWWYLRAVNDHFLYFYKSYFSLFVNKHSIQFILLSNKYMILLTIT